MKFKIKCCDERDPDGWWEEYDKDIDNPQEWARETITSFNHTLRPGERLRKVLEVVVLDVNSIKDHDWQKTNSFTIMKGSLSYDTMQCSRCGVTGKRYALGQGGTTIDGKYRAAAYQRCDTAMKKLGRTR